MRYLAMVSLVVCVLVMCGCGNREAARAAEQARQADAAVARDMVLALSQALDFEKMTERIKVWIKLIQQAERSSGVAVVALSPDEPVEVKTSEAQAIQDPDWFVGEAQKQVGRAEQEIEENRKWRSAAQVVGTWAAALAAGNPWVTALTGGGGIAALIATALGVAKSISSRGKALVESVRTGDELAAATTPEEVSAVKKAAAKRQTENGTRPLIAKALQEQKGI
jgi:hypothetical protein